MFGGVLESELGGGDLNSIMHSTFDELCNQRYGPLLVHNTADDVVHEHGRLGEVTPPLLQIGVQMSTLDLSRHRDINT